MTKRMRAGVTTATAGLALLFAGSALSAMTPKLIVGVGGSSAKATIGLNAKVGQADDWVGELQLYLPAGFKPNVPAGTAKVGTGEVTGIETLYGPDQVKTMNASVSTIGGTDPSLSWWSTNCDTSPHTAALMVSGTAGDDEWTFPIFVDQTSGNETQFGAYKLVACFGPRDTGDNNKFLGLSLTLSGFAAPTTPGNYVWRSLWTPFAGDNTNENGKNSTDTLNPAGSVEAQSTTRIASGVLSLAAKRSGSRVVLTGKLIIGGEAVSGATIALRHGTSAARLVALGSAKTSSAGTFSSRPLLHSASFFQAGATMPVQDLGAGGCKASFGVPCVDGTVGSTSFASAVIHLKK